MNEKKIFITGGAGYIGSHVVYELLKLNSELVVYDNFSNSSIKSLNRISNHLGKDIKIIDGDILDLTLLEETIYKYNINSVMHFAGLKSVNESINFPLTYYENNVTGTINLLKTMKKLNINELIFSSSATVYGEPKSVPIFETDPLGKPTNPYGASKLIIENLIYDLYKSSKKFSATILRYFNPVGAHQSGIIGEYPNGIPNNLMPYITQTAYGNLNKVSIFGDDYNTPDGTGIRDYIHVVDLAKGHIEALKKLKSNDFQVFNLGTGKGTSVFEMINTFKKVNKINVPYSIKPRREGDVASCYANVKKAKDILGWESKLDINDMCRDSWNWQLKNPKGYD